MRYTFFCQVNYNCSLNVVYFDCACTYSTLYNVVNLIINNWRIIATGHQVYTATPWHDTIVAVLSTAQVLLVSTGCMMR